MHLTVDMREVRHALQILEFFSNHRLFIVAVRIHLVEKDKTTLFGDGRVKSFNEHHLCNHDLLLAWFWTRNIVVRFDIPVYAAPKDATSFF